MTAPLVEQRCWNHELREAVCRCPGCGRCFCRECVTEHEERLLCAACLKTAAGSAPTRRRRRSLVALMALAGVLLSCLVFFFCGELVTELNASLERQAWQLH